MEDNSLQSSAPFSTSVATPTSAPSSVATPSVQPELPQITSPLNPITKGFKKNAKKFIIGALMIMLVAGGIGVGVSEVQKKQTVEQQAAGVQYTCTQANVGAACQNINATWQNGYCILLLCPYGDTNHDGACGTGDKEGKILSVDKCVGSDSENITRQKVNEIKTLTNGNCYQFDTVVSDTDNRWCDINSSTCVPYEDNLDTCTPLDLSLCPATAPTDLSVTQGASNTQAVANWYQGTGGKEQLIRVGPDQTEVLYGCHNNPSSCIYSSSSPAYSRPADPTTAQSMWFFTMTAANGREAHTCVQTGNNYTSIQECENNININVAGWVGKTSGVCYLSQASCEQNSLGNVTVNGLTPGQTYYYRVVNYFNDACKPDISAILAQTPSPSASPLPTPSASPNPTASCTDLTKNIAVVKLGDMVNLTCEGSFSSVIAPVAFFRYSSDNGTTWSTPAPGTGAPINMTTGRATHNITINKVGNWVAQCQVCTANTGGICTQWGQAN